MRRIRGTVAVLCGLAIAGTAPIPAHAQQKGYGPADLLAVRPALPGVEYDTPTDPKAIEACKVEVVTVQNRRVGYALRDGQGKMLRRFVALKGRSMDQWSYYQDGFEVYREVDLDGDRALDEGRWMNAGGMRVGRRQEGEDRRLEADLGRGGLEGLRPGAGPAMGGGDRRCWSRSWRPPRSWPPPGLPRDVVEQAAALAASRGEQVKRPDQVAGRLDPPDGLEPARRHLPPRHPRRPGQRAGEGRHPL